MVRTFGSSTLKDKGGFHGFPELVLERGVFIKRVDCPFFLLSLHSCFCHNSICHDVIQTIGALTRAGAILF
jgi:hypothetical protein